METMAKRVRLQDLTGKVRLRYPPNKAAGWVVQPNVYNRMLETEKEILLRIDAAGGLQALACPSAVVYDKPPYLVMPPQGNQFQQTGAVTLPGVAATNTLVVQWRVPVGYDGVITSLINFWSGGAGTFVEGSGDIVWRVQINRRWVRNYGNITTTLGSLTTPCQLFRGGIRIYANELITYYVSHAANAGLTGGNAVCSFLGYIYPLG